MRATWRQCQATTTGLSACTASTSAYFSSRAAYLVKMHGDDDHVIEVAYYINKHQKAYKGKEHVYLNAPEVELLGKGPVGEPPVA